MTRVAGTAVKIWEASLVEADDVRYSLTADGCAIAVQCEIPAQVHGFEGDIAEAAGGLLLLGPRNGANAAELRRRIPHLRPQRLGVRASFGFGDRLGLATRGHARAAARHSAIAPIFAQQSARELERTARSAQDVLDDAVWGVFAEGWKTPWGADADHVKTVAQVDAFLDAGFTFFTFDPGDHVRLGVARMAVAELRAEFDTLPWEALEDTPADLVRRHGEAACAPAVKYGRAIAHVTDLYRHLVGRAGTSVEVEVSVDETDEPTTPREHRFIAEELHRLGVDFVSLAPRFPGSFEKGVDYRGPLDVFEQEFAAHAEISHSLGGYRLSLHSGSDKFSLYGPVARLTRGLLHVKTSGTSYLEALRVVGQAEPGLLDEIWKLAAGRYEEDRRSYHVSADLAEVPAGAGLLDDDRSRQVLHVTFGSVLADPELGPRLMGALEHHQDMYTDAVEAHLSRHLELLDVVRP